MGVIAAVFMLLIVAKGKKKEGEPKEDAGGDISMSKQVPQTKKCNISDFQIMKLVLDWAIKE